MTSSPAPAYHSALLTCTATHARSPRSAAEWERGAHLPPAPHERTARTAALWGGVRGVRAVPGSVGYIPQVAETNTPRSSDVLREPLLYHKVMTRVFLADAKPEERSALRLLLFDLKMKVVGEAADWATTLVQAPISRSDMLLIDWDMLPTSPNAALDELRRACPAALVIILISQLDARQQAALSAGADAFISKGETPDRVAERLRAVAANIRNLITPTG
jgi:CheY-like chemotaxis protein